MNNTANGGRRLKLVRKPLVLKLIDLKYYRLGESGPTARHATDQEFLAYASSVAKIEGEDITHWTVEDRRDFLNYCFAEGVLEPDAQNILRAKTAESS